MNLPEKLNIGNIEQFLDKKEIIEMTAAQIMKDFGMFGVELSFSGNIEGAYDELQNQLITQIEELQQRNEELLLSILYQVDISKVDIQKTAVQFPHFSFVEVVAHQIIFRDLKKVLYRIYYRNK
ncbi:hypothetical protein EYV94_01310 [Puteibacter caeruleilacunae]|nr:hypothetical protein EYV94_01310 [Puteibacter caeruleilacunae]